MINDVTRAMMRAAAEALMTDTCTLEVGADAIGEYGEVLSEHYTVVASNVPCRVITIGNRFKEKVGRVGEREVVTDIYRLVTPHDTALAVDQRVTLDSDGSRWQVVDLVTERTDDESAQAVIVRLQ